MVNYFLIATIILTLFSCKNASVKIHQRVIVDSTPKLLIAGLPERIETNAMNTVAKKYGFHYERVGGCVVSKKLSDSMRIINAITYQYLENKFGKYWRNNFNREVDIISDLQYKVEQCLNNNEDIIKLNLAFKKDEYQMQYEIEPDAQKEIIIINAYDFEEIEGAFQKVTYYTISLDPKRKQLFFPL